MVNDMKKNGFTLIELIVTIALLGMVGVVISVNLTNMTKKQNSDKEAEFKKIVEDAACAYVGLSYVMCDETSGCDISGETLITKGLVDEKINGYSVNEVKVEVKFDNGKKICTMEGLDEG